MEKCCLAVDLRKGVQLFCVAWAVFCLAMIVLFSIIVHSLAQVGSSTFFQDVFFGVMIFELVLWVVHWATIILVLTGASVNNHYLLLPWIVVGTFHAMLSTFAFIEYLRHAIIKGPKRSESDWDPALILPLRFALLAILVYFVWCVVSLYRRIKKL